MQPVASATLHILSMCCTVMYCSSPIALRATMVSVNTIAIPEKIAPATKYGGKIVVCQPGITDVAKSMLTMECTENTSGVASPAKSRYTVSYRCHVRDEPVQPRLNAPPRRGGQHRCLRW